jgi:hypothetical protein
LVVVVFAFDVVVVVVVIVVVVVVFDFDVVVVVVTYVSKFVFIDRSIIGQCRVVFSLIWSSLKQHSEVQNISHSSRRNFDFIKKLYFILGKIIISNKKIVCFSNSHPHLGDSTNVHLIAITLTSTKYFYLKISTIRFLFKCDYI